MQRTLDLLEYEQSEGLFGDKKLRTYGDYSIDAEDRNKLKYNASQDLQKFNANTQRVTVHLQKNNQKMKITLYVSNSEALVRVDFHGANAEAKEAFMKIYKQLSDEYNLYGSIEENVASSEFYVESRDVFEKSKNESGFYIDAKQAGFIALFANYKSAEFRTQSGLQELPNVELRKSEFGKDPVVATFTVRLVPDAREGGEKVAVKNLTIAKKYEKLMYAIQSSANNLTFDAAYSNQNDLPSDAKWKKKKAYYNQKYAQAFPKNGKLFK